MPPKLGPRPAVAIGLIVTLCLLFFWRITLLGEVVYWGTPLLQFFPWRRLAALSYQSAQIPLWNPYTDFGAPLAANLQTAAFSPLNLIYLLFSVERAMGYTIVLHVALAGVTMYACGRALGLSAWGALFTGLAYMLSGYVIARAGFLSMVATLAWLPALIATAELTLSARERKRRTVWPALGLALATGLLLVAGHIQLAYYSLLLMSAYVLTRSLQLLWNPVRQASASLARLRQAFNVLWPVAAATGLGIGLAAVQLLPTAELAMHSARQSGPDYDLAMNFSLWPGQLVQILAPDFFGNPATGDYRGPTNYWEGTSYLGIPTLVLALFALRHGRHPARWFLLAFIVLGMLLAMGRFTPAYPWIFAHVPGFGLFQGPARLLVWSTFALALLSGIGLDTLLNRPDLPAIRRWSAVTLAGAGGFGIAIATTLVISGPGTVAGASLGSAGQAAFFFLATGVALRFVQVGRLHWWPAALCLLLTADLFSFGMRLTPTTTTDLYAALWPAPVRQLQEKAGLDRLYTSEQDFDRRFGQVFNVRDFEPSRTPGDILARATLLPNLGQVAGLHEVFNYDPLKLERTHLLRRLADTATDPAPLLSLMGVRWVIGQDGTPRETATPPMPRAYLIPESGLIGAADPTAALRLMQAERFDPKRQVILEDPAAATASPYQDGGVFTPATITAYQEHEVVVTTSAAVPSVLVLTDSFYPGWAVTIDGGTAPLYAANVAFRGVHIPPGTHTVTFRYAPRSFTLGLWVSTLSAAGIAGLAGWSISRGRMATAKPADDLS